MVFFSVSHFFMNLLSISSDLPCFIRLALVIMISSDIGGDGECLCKAVPDWLSDFGGEPMNEWL